jgi:hypothetical protein
MVRKNSDGTEIEYRTLKVTMEKDKYEIVMKNIKKFKIKQGQPDMTNGRALELMSEDATQ